MTRRLAPCALAICLLVGACTSGGDTATGTSPPVTGSSGPAPTGMPLVDGLPSVELLGPPSTGAGTAPLFQWTAVEGADSYTLAVIGPDGPLWAWRGADTEVYLGGLPFERPPGWSGPEIVAGSCWSVIARDQSGGIIAVSEYVPVSPDESSGDCVPGQGEEPTG